jgi:hypothetical protein
MSLELNRAQSELTGSSRKFSVLASVKNFIDAWNHYLHKYHIYMFCSITIQKEICIFSKGSSEPIKHQQWSYSSEEEICGK